AKYLRPGHEKPAVGRLQRHDADTGRAQHIDPGARGAELRPAGAAERQDGGVGLCRRTAVRRRERERACIVPTWPPMPQLESDGIASYTVTHAPPSTSTSAAISPAGPPPMTAMWHLVGSDTAHQCGEPAVILVLVRGTSHHVYHTPAARLYA